MKWVKRPLGSEETPGDKFILILLLHPGRHGFTSMLCNNSAAASAN
jgi:hypothetical protein